MLVLPAFQLATQQVADSQRVEVPTTKKELLEALQAGTVRPFDCGVFAPQQQVRFHVRMPAHCCVWSGS